MVRLGPSSKVRQTSGGSSAWEAGGAAPGREEPPGPRPGAGWPAGGGVGMTAAWLRGAGRLAATPRAKPAAALTAASSSQRAAARSVGKDRCIECLLSAKGYSTGYAARVFV